MQATSTTVAKPRRTSLSPFLVGDRVCGIQVGAQPAFDGEVIGVQGAYWLVRADDGSEWMRLTSDLELADAQCSRSPR